MFQVFHEGLKSWSCCNTVNKPVLDFEEFTKITVSSQFAIYLGMKFRWGFSTGVHPWYSYCRDVKGRVF